MIVSLWSINERINSLVCSILSKSNARCNNGIVMSQPGLSYGECSSILLPAISNSSSLSSAIRRIHLDETNSNSSELIHKWFFDNEKQILRFSNLKSLTLTRCLISERLVQSLSFLVAHQLDELRLIFDHDVFLTSSCESPPLSCVNNSGN